MKLKVDTANFTNASRQMTIWSNKINSNSYNLHSIGRRLKYLAQLSMSDMLINVKFTGMSHTDTKLSYIKEIFPNAYDEFLNIAADELESLK